MARFRIDENRSRTKPERRLGIKLERLDAPRGLGGKLDAYVPPELRYEYKPPSVFARYKLLTAFFITLLLGLLGAWLYVLQRPPPSPPTSPGMGKSAAPAPEDQPIFIEPLSSK